MQKQNFDELKKKLPRCWNKLISEKLDGKYTPGTVKQMINGYRTMNPAVLQVANEIIEFFNQKHTNENS